MSLTTEELSPEQRDSITIFRELCDKHGYTKPEDRLKALEFFHAGLDRGTELGIKAIQSMAPEPQE